MPTSTLSKRQKLAIFLVLIGPEMAAEVLRHFDDFEIEQICREMVIIELIDEDVQREILDEFANILSESAGSVRGGYDVTRKILGLARGEHQAQNLIGKMAPSHHSMEALNEIEGMESHQIFNLIKGEQSQTIAFLLSCLDSRKSAEILKLFNPELRGQVMLRMGTLESTSVSILNKVIKNLARHVDKRAQHVMRKTGGASRVAEIMGHLDKEISKVLLNGIEEADAQLGAAVRKRMFTFADLIRVSPSDMQRILRDIDTSDLVLAMKPASQPLKDKIFGALSKRAAEGLREEIDFLGSVRLKDVEAAQEKIIAVVMELEEQEEINLDGNNGGMLI